MGWGLRIKKLYIMGVHWKIWFLELVHKKTIYRGALSKKGGLGRFADLRGGLAKKASDIFEGVDT